MTFDFNNVLVLGQEKWNCSCRTLKATKTNIILYDSNANVDIDKIKKLGDNFSGQVILGGFR